MPDHGERSTEPHRIDTNGVLRRALRAALVAAAERSPGPTDLTPCDREPARVPLCASHTARQRGDEAPD